MIARNRSVTPSLGLVTDPLLIGHATPIHCTVVGCPTTMRASVHAPTRLALSTDKANTHRQSTNPPILTLYSALMLRRTLYAQLHMGSRTLNLRTLLASPMPQPPAHLSAHPHPPARPHTHTHTHTHPPIHTHITHAHQHSHTHTHPHTRARSNTHTHTHPHTTHAKQTRAQSTGCGCPPLGPP